MTLCDFFGSLSCNNSTKVLGTTCQDNPYLSFNQPHCTCCPPAESLSQNSSTSCCVSQCTTNEIASVNLKCGPPFKAVNSRPSRARGLPWASPYSAPGWRFTRKPAASITQGRLRAEMRWSLRYLWVQVLCRRNE